MTARTTHTVFALIAAAATLAGCAGTSRQQASMLRTPGIGQAELMSGAPASLSSSRVDLIAVTPQTIGLYANTATTAAGGAYLLGIGDVMQIFVVDEPELTLDAGYRVAEDGAISVPYLGRVSVANRGVADIRGDLTTRLAQYHSAPQVDVRITEFNARHVAVVGEVRQPNRQTLTDQPLTAIDAINAAGGFAEDPARANVVLIRAGVEINVDVQAFLTQGQATPALQDGDVLRVGARRIGFGSAANRAIAPAALAPVFLYHASGRADRISMTSGPVSLAQVAASAAPLPEAAVFVLRRTSAGVQALHMSAQDALNPAMGGRFGLQAGDTVTVQQNPSPEPHQLVAQLSPALHLQDQN